MSNFASGLRSRVPIVVVCALFAASASAQTPEPPGDVPPPAPEEPEPPAAEQEIPPDDEDAEDDDVEDEEVEEPEGEVEDDEELDDEESAREEADQEELEEDQAGDVDEVVIEYGETPEEDEIDGAAPIPMPRLTGPRAELQDENKLEPGADKDTGVQGRVVSRSPKKVLPDAPVTAKGERDGKVRTTLTDERGRYRLFLPPGQYTLRSFYDLYHGARWDDVQVQRGKFKRVNFVLDPITAEDAGVEEMEVPYLADTTSEAAQLNIRREAVAVQDAISAEEISRAGDGTAEEAASRVVGVTIDDGGRIIVRGLSGKYNRILLNDVPVPGVDPDVPAIKLNRFPTDIISNLAVVKTARPDLPGSFAGGLVRIQTENYPREFELKIGVSFGVNSISSFRQMPTYEGGNIDWLGFDDGTRDIPATLGGDKLDVARIGQDGRFQSIAEVDEVARTFPVVWEPRERTALPKLGLGFTMGNTVELGKKKKEAGYKLNFLYEYQDKIRRGFNRRFRFDQNSDAIAESEDFDFVAGIQEVLWGTFASGYVNLNEDNTLTLTSFFSRTSEDETLLQLGFTDENFLTESKNSFNFIGRTLFFNQLKGDHRNLGDSRAQLRWNAVGSIGRRDEPDRRQIRQLIISQQVTDATRFYSNLEQFSVAGNAALRFPLWQQAYGTVGVDGSFEDRTFDARRFAYNTATAAGASAIVGSPNDVLGVEGIGPVSTMVEVTRTNDSYDATNTLYGAYAQLETPITDWLKFLGLMRFEVFRQEVQSRDPFTGAPGESTDRTDLDPMPSVNLSFEINPEMYVKIGYGMTVIRPAIRELAPYVYVDFVRGWNITGNPELNRSRIQNTEARYEWYFGDTDLFAATVFYKYFDEPIEFIVESVVNEQATYQNAERAWLYGGELELRLGLGRFTDALQKLYFQGNLALIQSQTTQKPGSTAAVRQRELYQQSPFVTNASLRFDDPDSGVMVGLVYNAFGPRLIEVGGSSGAGDQGVVNPNVFEQTQHYLDLIASWRATDHLKVGFKWRNIAFTRVRYKQGDEEVLLENLGTSVSIGAEYIY